MVLLVKDSTSLLTLWRTIVQPIQYAGYVLVAVSFGLLAWARVTHRRAKSPLTLDEEKKQAKTRVVYRLLECALTMILGLVFLWNPF